MTDLEEVTCQVGAQDGRQPVDLARPGNEPPTDSFFDSCWKRTELPTGIRKLSRDAPVSPGDAGALPGPRCEAGAVHRAPPGPSPPAAGSDPVAPTVAFSGACERYGYRHMTPLGKE